MSDDSWRPPGWEDEPEPRPSPPPDWEQRPGGPSPAYEQAHWQAPPPVYSYKRPTEGTAIAVLVLAILSWLFVLCGGPILAVIALAMIPSARRKIEESRGALEGEGFLTASKWLALINLGLTALGIALLIFLAVLGAIFDSGTTQTEFGLLLSALR